VAGVDSEGMPQYQTKEKRQHKNRKSTKLSNKIHMITRVQSKGILDTLIKEAGGYNIFIGVIVQEYVSITCTKLRAKDYQNLRGLLLQMLFNRYKFGMEEGDKALKKIKEKALCMMIKALSMWQNMVNKLKDEDFEIVIKKEMASNKGRVVRAVC
jgi:hypothetical protein